MVSKGVERSNKMSSGKRSLDLITQRSSTTSTSVIWLLRGDLKPDRLYRRKLGDEDTEMVHTDDTLGKFGCEGEKKYLGVSCRCVDDRLLKKNGDVNMFKN